MAVRMEYLIIDKHNDEFCCDEKQLEHLLRSNSRVDIENGKLIFRKEAFDYSIKKWDIDKSPNEAVFHLVVSHESDDSDVVEKLDDFDAFIRRMNNQFGSQFVINTVWDDVSSYYETKLYPKMSKVEKMLRDIIYRFMIKAVGSSWYDTATPKVVKDAIGNTIQKGKEETAEEENQLSYADFRHLGMFLFEPYTLRPLGQRMLERIRKALDKGESVIDLLDEYERRSNWDRYFADKIPVEGLNEKWEKLYRYRNQVAHVKRMTRADYRDATRLIEEVIEVFEKCLDRVKDVDMSPEESSAVKEVAKKTVGKDRELQYILHYYPSARKKAASNSELISGLNRKKISDLYRAEAMFLRILNDMADADGKDYLDSSSDEEIIPWTF